MLNTLYITARKITYTLATEWADETNEKSLTVLLLMSCYSSIIYINEK